MFSNELKVKLFCFDFDLMHFGFVMIFYNYRHLILVVKNVCYLIFIFVFSSGPLINNFHRPANVALYCFIGCLFNDVYVFECFLSPSFGSQLSQDVNERVRNIMCVRTIPSLVVSFIIFMCFISFFLKFLMIFGFLDCFWEF